tara:strand:+ start:1016 stop:1675 length:660 start_codon:yes stop_codon:yes gene_type:complete
MKILGCVQPTYIPWYYFFYRIIIADVFVILDDVQYSKNNFFNRNKILNKDKEILLTVPVNFEKNIQKINEIKIDYSKNWRRKHWISICQSYTKSKYFNSFSEQLEKIYEKKFDKLIDLNLEIIYFFLDHFKIKKKIYLSSELKINSTGNEKLINLCKYFEADNFIVKKNTENYHPIELFQKQDIKFKYIEYDQVQSNDKLNFKPDMSIVDYACYNKDLT